ncbi:MAG: PKD domain-containing protein, partial [Myxococcota bacterium]
MVRRLLALTPFLLLSPACNGNDVDGVTSDATNESPVALLRTPVIAPADRPVLLDASASFDPDGDALTYSFELTDGSTPVATADPVLAHLFNGAGLFTVLVRATDRNGGEGVA